MSEDKFTEITCTFVTQTENAVLIDEGAKQLWVPKSIIEFGDLEIEDCRADDLLELNIATWFCVKNGLV